ncbi:MAG: cupin domain-containing protein, partial [Polyangiaceae bacterium]
GGGAGWLAVRARGNRRAAPGRKPRPPVMSAGTVRHPATSKFEIVSMLTISAIGLFSAAIVGCGGSEKIGKVAGPGLSIAPASLPDAAYKTAGNATVAFVDLTPQGTSVHVDGCKDIIIAVVKGHATALKQELAEGDSVVDKAVIPNDIVISGSGLAVVATVTTKCASGDFPPPQRIPANRAPELTWAGGAMHAHLDIENELHGDAYFGRLSGTAPLSEHVHETSTEILIVVEGSGTLTIDGKPTHLGPHDIVAIPLGAKHAWTPDAGSKLVAFQIYAPPGPEERFKALAAAGGAPAK